MFPLMGMLNRMIFWELVKVFLLSLVGVTGIFLTLGIGKLASDYGLTPGQVIEVIPLLIPAMLPYTIPTTTLFASCVVYGRLSNDNEVVAIKAAGVNLYTILRPAILLGLITSTLTLILSATLIPYTQTQIQRRAMEDPEEVLYATLKRERRLTSPQLKYVIYVKDVQGKRLIDVIVKQKSAVRIDEYGPHVEYDFVARAREARLIVDMETRTIRIDADEWVVADKNSLLSSAGAKPPEIPLPDSYDVKTIKTRPATLEWTEIDPRLAELNADREKLVADRAANARQGEVETDLILKDRLIKEDANYREKLKEQDRQIRNVRYEFHNRPALSFGCLVFALIGCPVGIWANRADYLSTFVICFLPTLLVYYPMLLAGSGLARDGKVPMFVGVWIANVVLGLAAVLLTYRLVKR